MRVATRWIFAAVLVAGVAFLALGLSRVEPAPATRGHGVGTKPAAERRLVSLAPSLTETLFALGAGDNVVGVTEQCLYPPEARDRPRVGTYYQPNYEAIFALEPDLVLTLEEHAPALPNLAAAGLRHLASDHRSWEGVLRSIETLGSATGREAEARQLRADLADRLDRIPSPDDGQPRPRVLLVIARPLGAGSLRDVCIAGADGLYDFLLRAAGGENVYRGTQRYPILSAEGLSELAPETVIELLPVDMLAAPGAPTQDQSPEAVKARGAELRRQAQADWQALPTPPKNLVFIQDDFAYVPGPRIVALAERFYSVLHGETAKP